VESAIEKTVEAAVSAKVEVLAMLVLIVFPLVVFLIARMYLPIYRGNSAKRLQLDERLTLALEALRSGFVQEQQVLGDVQEKLATLDNHIERLPRVVAKELRRPNWLARLIGVY
jgi:hypothetical protein